MLSSVIFPPVYIPSELAANLSRQIDDEQSFTLAPAREFLTKMQGLIDEQATVIEKVFPPETNVYIPFLERISEDVIAEYITPLLDEARERNVESYLEAMGALYTNIQQLAQSLKPVNCKTDEEVAKFREEAGKVLDRTFETHVDLYLADELEYFKKKAELQVGVWEKKVRSNVDVLELRLIDIDYRRGHGHRIVFHVHSQ